MVHAKWKCYFQILSAERELLNDTLLLLLVRFFLFLSPLGYLTGLDDPGMNHVSLMAFKLIPKLRHYISGRARSSLNILVSGTSFS